MIRIRKQEVEVDGEKMLIVLIRDFSDSINIEKMQLKQNDEKVSQVLMGNQLNEVFNQHSNSIASLVQ